MLTSKWLPFCLGPICLLSMLGPRGPKVYAQAETNTTQLQSLIPDAQDLPGFTRIRPTGWGHETATGQPSAASVVEDEVTTDADASQWAPGWLPVQGDLGRYSRVTRCLYSTDNVHYLLVTVSVCDTPQMAMDELHALKQASSAYFKSGTFSNLSAIGDESWVDGNGNLLYRVGPLLVELTGNGWVLKTDPQQVTPGAIEAVADEILLRASRQAKIIGVPAQDTHLAVNGKPLPDKALTVDRQTYVPVVEFAEAMGYASRWDSKTGRLTLSNPTHKAIAVTAGSTAATVGTRAVALKTPVLKQGGQPVMTLADLLTLVNGRVVKKGGTLQVKT